VAWCYIHIRIAHDFRVNSEDIETAVIISIYTHTYCEKTHPDRGIVFLARTPRNIRGVNNKRLRGDGNGNSTLAAEETYCSEQWAAHGGGNLSAIYYYY